MNTLLFAPPYRPLLESAWVGTGHSPQAADAAQETSALLDQLPLSTDLKSLVGDAKNTADAATRLLRIAAVIALHQQRLPPFESAPAAPHDTPASASEVTVIPKSPERPLLTDERWLMPLSQIKFGHWRLAQEYLSAVARAGWRLPPLVLPPLFVWAQHDPFLRAPLRALLGREGEALARSKAEWQVVLNGPTGNSPQEVLFHLQRSPEQLLKAGGALGRQAAMTVARQANPRAGRELLIQHFDALFQGEHAPLIETLVEGLSDEDVPFLQSLGSHPHAEIRNAAAALLLRLPDAPITRQACSAMASMLTDTPPQIKLDLKQHPPEAPGPETPFPAPVHQGLSDSSQRLYEIARRIPLSWWEECLQLDPAALIEWATASSWKKALMAAWKDVLLAAPDVAWCEAMLASPASGLFAQGGLELIRLLPQSLQDAALTRHWPPNKAHFGTPLILFMRSVPRGQTMSLPLSEVVIQTISSLSAHGELSGQKHKCLVSDIPELASLLHPHSLADWAELPRGPQERPHCKQALDDSMHICALRRRLHEEDFPQPHP